MSRSSGFEWGYRDQLVAFLAAFMGMAALALLIKVVSDMTAGVNQGTIVVISHWDPQRDADVDLWVRAPSDPPVGFSSREATHCNLLRDDLGHAYDSQSQNEEFVMCRGLDAGEWIVNVMLYAENDSKYPTWVTIDVERLGVGGGVQMLTKRVELTHDKQELTVFRFTLDKAGVLVGGSVNDIPAHLYSDGSPP